MLIRTPECLFKPKMLGMDIPGIHELIYQSIQKADLDLRRELYQSIYLSGGTTMFDGIGERLNKEVSALVPKGVNVKITAPVERRFSIWIGGSVLASLATFQSSWILAKEYEESGASIVNRKCF